MATAAPATKKVFANSRVTSGRSQDEVEAVITRYGGKNFGLMKGDQAFVVGWELPSDDVILKMRITIPLPDREELAMKRTNQSSALKRRTEAEIDSLMEREKDRLWRVLAYGLKGKLYWVDEGIELVEQALHDYIVNPGTNRTMYEETRDQVRESYRIAGHRPLTIMLPARSK